MDRNIKTIENYLKTAEKRLLKLKKDRINEELIILVKKLKEKNKINK